MKVQRYAIVWFYADAFLILEKLFSRSRFYNIACFPILAGETHLYATITLKNIFRSSSFDTIMFNCGPLIMDASLVSEDFFSRSRIPPVI